MTKEDYCRNLLVSLNGLGLQIKVLYSYSVLTADFSCHVNIQVYYPNRKDDVYVTKPETLFQQDGWCVCDKNIHTIPTRRIMCI